MKRWFILEKKLMFEEEESKIQAIQALVLAAGFGTRLKEVIDDRPKVMAPINGRPFLEYLLEILRRNGVNEVVIAIGSLGGFISRWFGEGEEWGIKISYSKEKHPIGTAETVKKAERLLKSRFLVVNGDTYLETDLRRLIFFHRERKAWATIALKKRWSTGGISFVSKKKSGQIISFIEKPEKDKEGWTNAGYYIFESEVLNFIRKNKNVSLEKETFPLLAKKGVLYGLEVKEDFIDIGTPRGYRKITRVLSRKKRNKK